ncbi:hypothetical protein ACSBR1_017640 [Camellia fascicularis]
MEFKHFSHPHGLCFRQVPDQVPETQCAGCNTPASGSVYTCRQCNNFNLHEQCFQATRSLNHPSHPSHPLSLFPYPTYPSSSFFCNSCNLAGTGFSFSCSTCEFDLHVHCAYMPVPPSPYPSFPIPNPSFPQESPSFSPPQYVYRPENTTHESVSINCPNQQYNLANQHYSFPHETTDFSPRCAYRPETTATHESFVNGPNPIPPQYTSPNEALSSLNAPMGLANQPAHAPYAGANQQYSFSHETPSFNPQYAYMPETSTTTHESVINNRPNPQYTASNQALSSTANQRTHAPYAVENQQAPVVNGPKPQYSQPNEALHNSSAQTGLANEGKSRADPPNQTHPRNVKHFSHHHALHLSKVQEEDYSHCSVCDQCLSGSAYSCTKQRCNFDIHKSCFELPQEIHHKSHPKHALTLLSSPPYKEYNEFTCNACREIGTGFTYHCKDCKFDLHVKCATLLETVKREDHEHLLTLLYSSPYKKSEEDSAKDLIFYCDVCQFSVDDSCWVYYCQVCDYGTDLHCVTAEKRPEEEETKEYSAEEAVAKAQQHMQLLQIQMEMSKQNAQFISGIAQSLSNLV